MNLLSCMNCSQRDKSRESLRRKLCICIVMALKAIVKYNSWKLKKAANLF